MININKIPYQVLSIIDTLEYEGYKAYLVGGAVRDLLLNREVHDWDIATNCPLEEIQKFYLDVKIVGASFGVALVHNDGMDIQVARFRTDGQYSDSRHPDSVEFVDDIMEDLKRRDFTINAMAWNPNKFVCVDGALDDLKNRVIRAVGFPTERFCEDPLRMLRAIRFETQLNFNLSECTGRSINKHAEWITNISAERIQEELNKILITKNPSDSMWTLYHLNLLHYIIPELEQCVNCSQNNHHKYFVFMHILEVVNIVPNSLDIRLAALFHDIGKPQTKTIDPDGDIHFYEHDEVSANIAQEILTRLRYSNDIIDEVVYLVRNHMELMNYPMMSEKGCRKLLNRHGEPRLKKLIEFRKADLLGSGTRNEKEVEGLIQSYWDMLDKVLQEKPATKFADLAIDGNDIMNITGLKPGKEIGKIKDYLMTVVIEEPNKNNKKDLNDCINYYRALNNLARSMYND
jgi:tRNA nucleotidyltransferase (CCA-adding enzyme)